MEKIVGPDMGRHGVGSHDSFDRAAWNLGLSADRLPRPAPISYHSLAQHGRACSVLTSQGAPSDLRCMGVNVRCRSAGPSGHRLHPARALPVVTFPELDIIRSAYLNMQRRRYNPPRPAADEPKSNLSRILA